MSRSSAAYAGIGYGFLCEGHAARGYVCNLLELFFTLALTAPHSLDVTAVGVCNLAKLFKRFCGKGFGTKALAAFISYYFENGEKLLVRISGMELYRQLSDFEGFYHCGRAHIINLKHISKITPKGVIFKNSMQLCLPHTVLTGLRTAFFDFFHSFS